MTSRKAIVPMDSIVSAAGVVVLCVGIRDCAEQAEGPSHVDAAALHRDLGIFDTAAEERAEPGRQPRLVDRDLAPGADRDAR